MDASQLVLQEVKNERLKQVASRLLGLCSKKKEHSTGIWFAHGSKSGLVQYENGSQSSSPIQDFCFAVADSTFKNVSESDDWKNKLVAPDQEACTS